MDQQTKEPFPAERRLASELHQTGLQQEHAISLIPSTGNVDGKRGDMLLLSPAYNVSRSEVELIVDRALGVVQAVLGE